MQGVTLLETLIAFFVLSGGMLGLAFMQAQAIKLNTESYVRTQATILAYDLIDRIKLNNINIASYTLDKVNFDSTLSCDPGISDAVNDLGCWQKLVALKLPQGQASVAIDTPVASSHTLTLFWVERLTRADPNDASAQGEERSQSWSFVL